jgi:apolipoprotein N-acyltransferase
MQISFLKSFSLLLLSAIVLGLSFPYTGSLFPLAFIALVPLFLFNTQLNDTLKFKALKRFFGNYLFFVIYNLFTTWWIYNASESGAYMAFAFNSILMALPFNFYGFIHKHLGTTKGLIGFIAVWISFEHLHHYWDLSWPWLTFGNIFSNQPWMIQWYEYSGVEGGTLWILLVNLFIFLIIRNVYLRKESFRIQTPLFALVILSILLPIGSSLVIYNTYNEKLDPVNVVVVQPNLNPYTAKFTMPVSLQVDRMLKIAEEKVTDSTDIIVCPETALASYSEEKSLDYLGYTRKLRKFSESHNNVPFIIGADTYGEFEESRAFPAQKKGDVWIEKYNTALLLDANNPIEIYHKSKLVLGAEKLPFVDIFPFMAALSIDLGGTNGILVSEPFSKNFEAKGVKYAPLICYESVYGEFVTEFTAKGADVLCVITNDGWWHDTPGYKQHAALSQIRAIENRRSVVRSANTGISCVINQKGDIVQSLDWDIEGGIAETVNKNTEITFFVRYGDVIGRICVFIILGLLLYAFTSMLKNKGVLPTKQKH